MNRLHWHSGNRNVGESVGMGCAHIDDIGRNRGVGLVIVTVGTVGDQCVQTVPGTRSTADWGHLRSWGLHRAVQPMDRILQVLPAGTAVLGHLIWLACHRYLTVELAASFGRLQTHNQCMLPLPFFSHLAFSGVLASLYSLRTGGSEAMQRAWA